MELYKTDLAWGPLKANKSKKFRKKCIDAALFENRIVGDSLNKIEIWLVCKIASNVNDFNSSNHITSEFSSEFSLW